MALCILAGVGIYLAGKALLSPDLEWRLLTLAGLAFAIAPFRIEAHTRNSNESIPLPLWHSTLFAGSIALGPFGAVLPGAFYGTAKLVLGSRTAVPIYLALYSIIKPMVACLLTSLAYVWSGGSVLRPQAVDSFLPMLAAALIYIAVNVALTVATPAPVVEHTADRRTVTVVAAWALSLLAGYAMAVLYAVAPTYVLLGPCLAAGFAGYALRKPEATEKISDYTEQPQVTEKITDPSQEPVRAEEAAVVESTDSFVDPTTGLANERYLDMFLQRELSRAARQERSISVAVFDLDGARKLNKSARKDGPDSALSMLCERLKEGVREYDLVARLSSNRLLVVLPELSSAEAYEVATRLHRTATSGGEDRNAISASVGIATFPESGSTPEELIHASHRVLNHGRLLGPNRVHVSRKLAKTG